ncbi:MAG: SRPBCC family protein [Chthoniobacteraceae bacterium]
MRTERNALFGLALGFAISAGIFTPAVSAPNAVKSDNSEGGGWKIVSQSATLTIHNRSHREPGIQEVKATGLIDAKPAVVRRVLEDTDAYPQFMPYVIESRLIARESGAVVVYQRMSPPLMKDVDYTMRMRFESYRADGGATGHRVRWDSANDLQPAEKKGVVRLTVNNGSWLLEPTANDGQTRATYWLHSDCGRAMSPALVGIAYRTSIPKMFEGVRKRAKLAKYSAPK